MELLDRDTFLEWMERIMSRFDHLKQTIPDIPQRPMLNGEPLLDNQEVCMMLQVSKRPCSVTEIQERSRSISSTTKRGIWNRR